MLRRLHLRDWNCRFRANPSRISDVSTNRTTAPCAHCGFASGGACNGDAARPFVVIARRVVVHGIVQGVGFRAGAVSAARACGVTGWVRNRRDGTVEAFVQGTPDAVAAMIRWCHDGPRGARVTRVEASDAEPSADPDFDWWPTT